ncbi:hypothetical protein FOA52_006987 [Chlamydomonas sp. UWO 241]|nr:hypothetical protein FOA52_006987 [Chlamydomonas sp. UWO 241]
MISAGRQCVVGRGSIAGALSSVTVCRAVGHAPHKQQQQQQQQQQPRSAVRVVAAQAVAARPPIVSSSKLDGAPFDCGVGSVQGLRDNMEDGQTLYYDQAVGVIYAGVYDGHGGEQAAEWLTAELHPILLGALKANPPATHADLEDVMTAAFEDADARVIAELERQGRDVLENAGSTATVVMVGRGGQVMVANCGDSQCFVLRGGRAKELTTPHRTYGGGKDVKV